MKKYAAKNNPPDDSPDALLTIHEVATIFRVDDTTARRWVQQGALEAISLPHLRKRTAYRIRRATINTILDK
jgi:excisionase family DNA binding protein